MFILENIHIHILSDYKIEIGFSTFNSKFIHNKYKTQKDDRALLVYGEKF